MDVLTLLETVQTIARNGLNYAENPYDRERYEQLLALSFEGYTDLLELPSAELRSGLERELGHITPKLGSDAALFDAEGRILLMDRADGSGWCLPCGWVEPNERPIDTAIRETKEETGLDVRVQRLVGVFSRPASLEAGPHSSSGVVHLCEVIGGELRLSHEGRDLRYLSLDDVPRWHPGHERKARSAQAMWRSEGAQAISD